MFAGTVLMVSAVLLPEDGAAAYTPSPAAYTPSPAARAARPARPPHHPYARPSRTEIAALFDDWSSALATGDPDLLAARYAPDAVLLPTASARIRTTHDEIRDYFTHFLRRGPRAAKIRTVISVLGRDSALDCGLYAFTVTDPVTGAPETLEARYTYLYERRGGKWLITHHHSSRLPAG